MAFREAMQDLRALNWLADLIGPDKARALVADWTLDHCPTSSEEMLTLRDTINRLITENL